ARLASGVRAAGGPRRDRAARDVQRRRHLGPPGDQGHPRRREHHRSARVPGGVPGGDRPDPHAVAPDLGLAGRRAGGVRSSGVLAGLPGRAEPAHGAAPDAPGRAVRRLRGVRADPAVASRYEPQPDRSPSGFMSWYRAVAPGWMNTTSAVPTTPPTAG